MQPGLIMEKVLPLKRLWQLIVLDRQDIGSIYFYAILSGLLQLSVPIGVQAIIGFVLGASMVTSIYILAFLVVLGVLVVGVMQINQMKIIEKIQQNLFTRNAFEFAEKIPRIDLQKADDYYLPEKVNRFFETVNIQKGLSKLLLDIPTASIQIIFSLLLLTFYHPMFIIFGILLIVTLAGILRLTGKSGLETSFKESKYKYAVAAWLQEIARVVKSFKYSQGTHLNLRKTDQYVVGYLAARTAHFRVLMVQYVTLVIFKVLITAAMLLVGTYLLLNQELNIGEFIAAEIVILTVIAAVEKLIGNLDNVYDIITGLEKIASVTETYFETEGKLELNSQTQGTRVEMMNFSFAYPEEKEIFTGINLLIPAKSKVCIQGNDGSGKTTFLKVLSGNYSEFKGALLLNNLPITNYQLESLRAKTGVYLNQQDIFTGTLLENISMGRADITPQQILKVADELGLHNLFHNLPHGFETWFEPTGRKMPATLVKKILLLRAFAHDPDLLLLEEPWEGLDEATQKAMHNYLLNKNNHATIFVTSNDEAFASACDYIIVLNDTTATLIKN